MQTPSELDIKKYIYIKNAHLNNLKNIDLWIPKNKLIVITGVSGSGKSSLAFDTIFAEGQRRYVESLSAYARQFLGKLEKPKVDDIKGLAPSIAIQQKVISNNPRSTVGTSTEIYDYLKLLFARVGRTISPLSGKEVKKDEVNDVMKTIELAKVGTSFLLYIPLQYTVDTFNDTIVQLKKQGFAKLEIAQQLMDIEDLESFGYQPAENTEINLVIDRFITNKEETFLQRIADSVQTAFYEGKGKCILKNIDTQSLQHFSNQFELDGISFVEPNIHFFSFNNPFGACPKCEGFAKVIGINEDLVVPNKKLSVYEECVAAWRGESMREWKMEFIKAVKDTDFPIHKPYSELNEAQKELLWKGIGKKKFPCINQFFSMLEDNLYKIQYRVLLSRYRGKTNCNTCNGTRLREETKNVKIVGYAIQDLINLPIDELYELIKSWKLNEHDQQVSKRILFEINSRLSFLLKVGLGYLTLNRTSNSLSGGESQRINLATSLGSSLVGSIYILDEPSIGLHSRDTENLIEVLKKLRDIGNTVIVVEHDEDMMKAADHIIDIGPEAGYLGGNVVYQEPYSGLKNANTLTANYLNGTMEIAVPKKRRSAKEFIELIGARENNLKNIDIKVPLQNLVVITGVSGSGKSTLIKEVLVNAILAKKDEVFEKKDYDEVRFNSKYIEQLELIDQNPIGKSSRSNPITYLKAFDEIRDLYSKQKAAKLMGFLPKHFSFNVEGGRCEECKGDGTIQVSMQFMADIELVCEHCNGKRFKEDVLEIKFDEKSIFDILDMTVDDAIAFFKENNQTKIQTKIEALKEVGLGYLRLGQSSSSLSGGEAQRVKLASYLIKGQTHKKTLFVFDEPSTGLHFQDIQKLLYSLQALVDAGHSVLVIEHQMDIIKCADYLIDIGPEGGKNGGNIVYEGKPEGLLNVKSSYTAHFLKDKLSIID